MKKIGISSKAKKVVAIVAIVALSLGAFAGCRQKNTIKTKSIGDIEKEKLIGTWDYVGNVSKNVAGKSSYAPDGQKYGTFEFKEDGTLSITLYKEDGTVRTNRTYNYKVTNERYLKTYLGEEYVGPDYKIGWVEDELRLFEYWRTEENKEDSPYKKNTDHNGYILEKTAK